MNKKIIKVIQQAIMIAVACFLLWVAFSHSFSLVSGMDDVDLGKHGNIALTLTVVFGIVFGIGIAGLFFFLAHKQSEDE